MEYEHSASMAISFDTTQAEMRRPFYLVRAEMHNRGKDYWEATFGGVSGFGKTPQIASIAFDLVWLNGSIDNAATSERSDTERLDWLDLHMECHTESDSTDMWQWSEAKLTNRDLRKAIDLAMDAP